MTSLCAGETLGGASGGGELTGLCVDLRLQCVSNDSAATEPPQTELASVFKLPGPAPEEAGSCDVTESSSELKPRGLDPSGEEGAPGDGAIPPELAAPEEGGRERSVGSLQLVYPSWATRGRIGTITIIYSFSLFRQINTYNLKSHDRKLFCFCSSESDQDVKPDLTSPSENIGQEEMFLKGQDKDGDDDKSEKSEEEENVLAESRAQSGDDAAVQEVTGAEPWPAGSSVSAAEGPFLPGEGAEGGLRSRSAKLFRKSFGL